MNLFYSGEHTHFKENKKAWDFFIKQAPSYRKAIISWIMSASQGKNRQRDLKKQ